LREKYRVVRRRTALGMGDRAAGTR
jgi:hypothetical protein